jgi:hypothetical protein
MAGCRRGGCYRSAVDAESDHGRSCLGNNHHGGAFGRTAPCDVSAALGLSKEIYAGTTSLFFTVGNATKAVPCLLVKPTAGVWTLMAICLFAIPGGVGLGWRLHGSLDQRQIYRVCYGLLVVTALKLLWDGVSGYLA